MNNITGLILAGGRGSRMGGADKGLQEFQGKPLVQHALSRLAPQVQSVLINANRHLDVYQRYGVPVVSDASQDFSGPLSGFLAGLKQCQTPLLLTVPCDVPRFPHDLTERLLSRQQTDNAEIAMASALEEDGKLRTQPVFCLLKRSLVPSLENFLSQGGRKIDAWTAQHRTVEVPFDQASDDPLAFANVNTLEELHALEATLTTQR